MVSCEAEFTVEFSLVCYVLWLQSYVLFTPGVAAMSSRARDQSHDRPMQLGRGAFVYRYLSICSFIRLLHVGR